MGLKILAVGLILLALPLLGVTGIGALSLVTGILIVIGAIGVIAGY